MLQQTLNCYMFRFFFSEQNQQFRSQEKQNLIRKKGSYPDVELSKDHTIIGIGTENLTQKKYKQNYFHEKKILKQIIEAASQ